jgi:molybdate transport system regulatory protein
VTRPRPVTDADIALLEAIRDGPSVVAASRRLGISRDRAVYRLARLETAFGGPIVVGRRGGAGHGESRLSALGERIVHGGYEAVEILDARATVPPPRANRLSGTYRDGPGPAIVLSGGATVRVAFPGEPGERVTALLDPDSILVGLRRFPTSARNVLAARVVAISPGTTPGARTIVAAIGPDRLRVTVTEESRRRLGLTPGRAIWLFVKATAIRRVGRPHQAPRVGSGRAPAERP